jgi:hypothetical protein
MPTDILTRFIELNSKNEFMQPAPEGGPSLSHGQDQLLTTSCVKKMRGL